LIDYPEFYPFGVHAQVHVRRKHAACHHVAKNTNRNEILILESGPRNSVKEPVVMKKDQFLANFTAPIKKTMS